RRALAGVARVQGRAGLQAVASMLVGDASERGKRFRLDRLSTVGVLAGKSTEEAPRGLRVLLADGGDGLSAPEHPVPTLTKPGWFVMRGDQDVRVRLPPPPPPRRAKVRAAGAAPAKPPREPAAPRAAPEVRARPAAEPTLFESL